MPANTAGRFYTGADNPSVTVDDIRMYIKDFSDRNRLLQASEFSDDRIRLCMEMALDDFNTIPIQTAFTLDGFPSRTILLLGTIAHMYKGEKIFQARNNLTYNDGGISVNDTDKAAVYEKIGDQFMQEFETKTRWWKREFNLAQGWGGFGSEYAGFYRTR
jgi:hypothetical protein